MTASDESYLSGAVIVNIFLLDVVVIKKTKGECGQNPELTLSLDCVRTPFYCFILLSRNQLLKPWTGCHVRF
jgi:hypothetical protein